MQVRYEPTRKLTKAEQAKLERRRAEELARQEAARKAREEEDKKAKEARNRAENVARQLLLDNLRAPQRQEFEANQAFIVQAASGRRYRIKLGWAGNVEELNPEHKPINRFCIHPRGGAPIPEHDNCLAQKLMLETDEDRFLKIANRTAIPVGCN